MSRPVLPPLADRRTRVRLLAWSYEDAAFGSNDGGRGSKPQSRCLSRNLELWCAGSYDEFEQAVDWVRRTDTFAYRRFWVEHVETPFKSARPLFLHPVVKLMPHSIYVPAVIAEAAGYLPSEAKSWAMPAGLRGSRRRYAA